MELTLTTRKIVFGLLMLVLAFSEHGIADAEDTPADADGRLTVRVDPFNGAPGTTATVTFTAIGADNQPAFIRVNLSAIGGTLSQSSELTGTAGSGTGTVTLTRGNTPGTENYVTASTPGYTSVRARFLISGTAPPPPTMPTTAGIPDSLDIYAGDDQNGVLNTPLTEPIVVKVLDANEDPVKDVRVRFRVTQGSGSFSPRTPRTDAKGLAETIFTPTAAGRIRIMATVAGVDETVRFIAQGREPADQSGMPSADPVSLSTPITPKVHVAAANRPPMLWVDGGAIYALVGETSAQRFVPSVDNALNIAIGGDKVYWTEATGASSGTINSANLDGSGVTELTTLLSVPMGIAVDATGNKLYWTNSRGRLQRATLNGNPRIENLIEDVETPKAVALDVSGGKVYWAEVSGVWRADLNGGNAEPVVERSGIMGIAVSGGQLYWTEKTAMARGSVWAAALDGETSVIELASLQSVPIGIAVDPTRQKLYWTNSRGRLQRATLNGNPRIQNVVTELQAPGGIVVVPVAAPAAFPQMIAAAPALGVSVPTATALLMNYPNPFNPETWIPYQLATDTDVRLTIYASNGVVVRALQLGHQTAGYYTDRDRAAYWDGRNAFGEQVASGLYFYQLETDDMSSLRKMVILK